MALGFTDSTQWIYSIFILSQTSSHEDRCEDSNIPRWQNIENELTLIAPKNLPCPLHADKHSSIVVLVVLFVNEFNILDAL